MEGSVSCGPCVRRRPQGTANRTGSQIETDERGTPFREGGWGVIAVAFVTFIMPGLGAAEAWIMPVSGFKSMNIRSAQKRLIAFGCPSKQLLDLDVQM